MFDPTYTSGATPMTTNSRLTAASSTEPAETHSVIRPIRDSLIAWADRDPDVTSWDLVQHEDGTCWLDLWVPRAQGLDARVRLEISLEGL
jgi:hypothetical protein